MGNCMERSSDEIRWQGQEHEEKEQVKQKQVEEEEEEGGEGKKRVRIKVVLTREELQWLILQLNQKQAIGLDQVLEEIQRSREKAEQGWKPSLESIMEIPEVPEMDR
ncbi:hypothetical protein QN277_028391 [Acacia crassicarpa]|uniref:Uncharacterized protein n=1 Tax=Acacia crassicarpa TaxID=499986 RepID=A0AAE1J334_9FABA|nr:hypothetical protein QN277_028391 [Acacia crassicarpa]